LVTVQLSSSLQRKLAQRGGAHDVSWRMQIWIGVQGTLKLCIADPHLTR
jgi:hypothetical protein